MTEKQLTGSKLRFIIRCQRLNAVSREYEEVEVEVPSPIYETIKLYNHQEMQQGGADLIFGLAAINSYFGKQCRICAQICSRLAQRRRGRRHQEAERGLKEDWR